MPAWGRLSVGADAAGRWLARSWPLLFAVSPLGIGQAGVEFTPSDIGSPVLAGGTLSVPGGVDVTGAGKTIGGASDQFQFGWQERSGNFDVQARVEEVTVTDAFLQAGLMARESLDGNARFAAAFASSPQLGSYFGWRATVGSSTSNAAPRGGFPVNYPHTWLRLQRVGNTFAGYASLDGRTWTQLGSATLTGLSTAARTVA